MLGINESAYWIFVIAIFLVSVQKAEEAETYEEFLGLTGRKK